MLEKVSVSYQNYWSRLSLTQTQFKVVELNFRPKFQEFLEFLDQSLLLKLRKLLESDPTSVGNGLT